MYKNAPPVFWLNGEKTQNFGDFLSEYIYYKLFDYKRNKPPFESDAMIIGSAIDDWIINNIPTGWGGEGLKISAYFGLVD